MKTLLIVTLLSGIASADNCYIHDRGSESWVNCQEQAEHHLLAAIGDQTNAMQAQTDSAEFYAMLNSAPSPGISVAQLEQLGSAVRQDQKNKDIMDWSPVIDNDKKPMFLLSPDGRYKIGPVYVKAGSKWEPVK